jgi:hypothetical protein
MESISEKKLNITRMILDVQDDSVLNEIEQLLSEAETVAYTSEGKPLTRSQYSNHLEEISRKVQEGKNTYSPDEVKKYILNPNS